LRQPRTLHLILIVARVDEITSGMIWQILKYVTGYSVIMTVISYEIKGKVSWLRHHNNPTHCE
jgi:hypothetical protein